ncbi:MAG: HU family DNA-binding protein [Erysipelotrichaceae bacterium]|jgi:DNA-binding protein HU-beta|nr:HU family DNA-binding protein [Erysipelotrichaceae bacterium]
MHKKDLVEKVSSNLSTTQKETAMYVEAIIETITASLLRSEDVVLSGFGTLSIIKKKARIARIPSSGKEIKIPAKKAVKFKASKNLKEKIK